MDFPSDRQVFSDITILVAPVSILLLVAMECMLSKHMSSSLSCESTGVVSVTYCTFLVTVCNVVATLTHLGYVSLFVAFITLVVLVSAIIWGMFASTAVARSFSWLIVVILFMPQCVEFTGVAPCSSIVCIVAASICSLQYLECPFKVCAFVWLQL